MADNQDTPEICPACGEKVPAFGTCCGFSGGVADESIPLMAELVLVSSGDIVPVISRWVRIGRDHTNQIVLTEDHFASRYHAWVTYEQGVFWIEDLGSTNGTLLNGQQLERRELLAAGDRIKVGETEMIFNLLTTDESRPDAESKPAPGVA